MNNLSDFIDENSNSKWEEYVKSFLVFSKDIFLTYDDFSLILDKIIDHPNSKIQGLKLEIKSAEDNAVIYTYAKNADDSPDNLDNVNLDAHNWFKLGYSIWYGSIQKDGTKKDEVISFVKELVKSFWKTHLRDEKTRIWTKLLPDTNILINKTLTYYKEKCHYITFIYSDLDNFTKLNDHGSQAADAVLLQMANNFSKFIIKQPAVLLHDKGDEFIILVFTMFIEDALTVAYNFKENLKGSKFKILTKAGEVDVESEVTVGINIRYTQTNDDISFTKEIGLAEETIKKEGIKNYKTANLYNSSNTNFIIQPLNNFAANISKLNLKLSSNKKIFRNVWLNFITEQVHKNDKDFEKVKEILEWIKPDYSKICSSSHEYSSQPDYSKNFSSFDVLIAVLRGVIKTNLGESNRDNYFIKSHSGTIAIHQGDNSILSLEDDGVIELEIGTFSKNGLAPLALLVKIGHADLKLPEKIFGNIIIVDDRPSSGGGLPDFWELALAKVVKQINSDPNIKRLYLIGDKNHGRNTVDLLQKISKDKIEPSDIETIIYKIQTTNSDLLRAKARLSNAVEIFEEPGDLVEAYAKFITEGKAISIQEKQIPQEKQAPHLKKEVRLEEHMLSKQDGFRVGTLSEAYPLMLEIARLSTFHNNIRDQARGLLGELIDFKVELSNPTKEVIPFYFRADSLKFEDYFQSLFIQEEGLFAKHLNTQLETVLAHLEESITVVRKQYSTRRAILIIPNSIPGSSELKPLGLVSLRIIPRFENAQTVALVLSYTWRTVEALVGFPYSLFGSIRYGEYIQQLLQKRVDDKGIRITFDKVSYIANSLHIFMDEQGQAIAKSIINDASI